MARCGPERRLDSTPPALPWAALACWHLHLSSGGGYPTTRLRSVPSVATLAWLMASVLTWIIHENILRRLGRKLFGAPRHSGGIIVQGKSSVHRSSDE